MPNIPLPKPAAPPAPSTPPSSSGTVPKSGTVQVQPPKPQQPTPQSNPAAPSAAPVPQAAPKAPVAPAPMPPAPQPADAPSPRPIAPPTPQAPPAPTPAAPQSPTPTPPVAPVKPAAPQIPAGPIKVQQPPQTLSALSSMASNRLPSSMPAHLDGSNKTQLDPTLKPTAQPAPATPAKPKLDFVQPKKPFMKYLPFIGGGLILLFLVIFLIMRFVGGGSSTTPTGGSSGTSGGTTGTGGTAGTGGSGTGSGGTSGTSGGTSGTAATGKAVSLEYWGLWEPTEAIDGVLKDFEAQNSGVTIKYTQQSYRDYRTRLQQAVSSGNGPDIFRFHASWVPMLGQELAQLPSAVMSSNEFAQTFYPVAAEQLQNGGQLVGIPIMYDGLILYYNTDIFETAVVTPPKTWSEVRSLATKLTIKSGDTITRGGVALGNASNVEHFADVIAVLMLQNGADLTKPNSPQTRDALLFYTNFIKTDRVWSDALPSSTVAFARGEVAMMFAPSWRAHEIKALNPDLKFATVPLPQLSDTRIGWASYWAEGVSSKSQNKDAAWKFLKYMSSKDVQQKLHAEQSQVRSFGEIYARKDLADQMASNPVASSVVQDAPYAKGFGMSSFTHDAGLNDQLIQYYRDAVNALLSGTSIDEVQKTLEQGVNQVLKQYGVSEPTTSTSGSQKNG